MRIVFMGTPEFAVTPLKHLVLGGYEVVAVYTQPDRPAGRGRSLLFSKVKEAALKLGLPVVQPENLKSAEVISRLADYKPDVIVVAAFAQILPQTVLDIPACGCINIHPSLLPRHRGASPVAAAILAGDEFTGVSIMLQDAGLDTGPVLSRAAVPVSPQDSTGSLTEKLSLVAANMLQETLARWLRGEIIPQSQNESEVTYFPRIAKEAGEIDWQMSALEIWRRVRAYTPWPGSYTRWRGKQLKIIEAVPVSGESTPGQVVSLPDYGGAPGIGTGDGILRLIRLQQEGKREMPADEFLRGQRDFIGSVLPD